MSKAEDLRSKTEDELRKELIELKKEQLNLRFQQTNGQLENTSRVRTVRRQVARIKTILSQQLKTVANKKTTKKEEKVA